MDVFAVHRLDGDGSHKAIAQMKQEFSSSWI